jgi:hypothetical protein
MTIFIGEDCLLRQERRMTGCLRPHAFGRSTASAGGSDFHAPHIWFGTHVPGATLVNVRLATDFVWPTGFLSFPDSEEIPVYVLGFSYRLFINEHL